MHSRVLAGTGYSHCVDAMEIDVARAAGPEDSVRTFRSACNACAGP